MLRRLVRIAPKLAFAAFLAVATAAAQTPVTVFSQTVPLDPRRPTETRAGELEFRGGIALRSTDPRFGGFSGIHVSTDGTSLLAVSDRGAWLRLALVHDRNGHLIGAGRAEMGALIDENGRPLSGTEADAEALAAMPDGSFLVAFERHHRILHYPEASPPFSKPPTAFPIPQGLEQAPANGGLEALAQVGRGYLVAIAERLQAGGGALAAWVGRNGVWEPFAYARKPGLRVTDAGLLPGGDILVLEHRYSAASGSVVRFVRVTRSSIAPYRRVEGRELALLTPPLTTENFEAVSIRRGQGEDALVYVMSDDNFNPLQRTLLLLFAVKDPRPAPPAPPQ
ncbi:MAG: esterase-like activity of phytase family protein [Rhodospirillaceae bacterium]|nr:esterase-like activity of phytase family protein [Rhodospirillaceae bacterium]